MDCRVAFFLLFVFYSFIGASQGTKQGKFVYDIDYSIDNTDQLGIEAQLPYKCILYTDGSNWKATWVSNIGENYSIFYLSRLDSAYHVVKIGGKQLIVPLSIDGVKELASGAETFLIAQSGFEAKYSRKKAHLKPIDETYFRLPEGSKTMKAEAYDKLLR